MNRDINMSKRGRPVGYKLSDKSKALIGANSKGRLAFNRREVNINGVFYNSVREASIKLDVNPSTVTSRIKSKSEQFKDWKYN